MRVRKLSPNMTSALLPSQLPFRNYRMSGSVFFPFFVSWFISFSCSYHWSLSRYSPDTHEMSPMCHPWKAAGFNLGAHLQLVERALALDISSSVTPHRLSVCLPWYRPFQREALCDLRCSNFLLSPSSGYPAVSSLFPSDQFPCVVCESVFPLWIAYPCVSPRRYRCYRLDATPRVFAFPSSWILLRRIPLRSAPGQETHLRTSPEKKEIITPEPTPFPRSLAFTARSPTSSSSNQSKPITHHSQ
ncbi:uncharacterized protein LOC103460751 [Poecilia reticulata]|uniref:uncharacterized protein LOC103460751 n=1 Tax=Poecilia reticulata TaxID=8081 RepID=UPI0004A3630C|nr:PREDICTED: uncharacterized protein LOC103460751 [Poecilia reticulata]